LPDVITVFDHPSRVRKIVHQAVSNKLHVAITFPEVPARGRSSLLSFSGQEILLSTLRPAALTILLEKGAYATFAFEDRGVMYWFGSRVFQYLEDTRDFLVGTPTKVWRVHRRQSFRVEVSEHLPGKILYFEGFPDQASIRVENLSAKGLALSFPGDPRHLFKDEGTEFEMDLGKAGRVREVAVLRSLRRLPSGRFLAGMEIRQLSVEAERVLSQFVTERQREDLKKD